MICELMCLYGEVRRSSSIIAQVQEPQKLRKGTRRQAVGAEGTEAPNSVQVRNHSCLTYELNKKQSNFIPGIEDRKTTAS